MIEKKYFCAWQMRDDTGRCELGKMRDGIKPCRKDCEYYPKPVQLLLNFNFNYDENN